MKDYFEAQGETDIHGSRDAFRLAFKRGLIEAGETWMDMIKSRTLTSLTLAVLYKIMDELDDLLLPYTIDLSIYSHIGDADVIAHIQRVGVTFYEKGEAVSESVAAP